VVVVDIAAKQIEPSQPSHSRTNSSVDEIATINIWNQSGEFWLFCRNFSYNETPRSKLRGISTKDISNNNAASSGVFTL